MSDEPRYLHRRSEFGYTHLASKGLPGAGEPVSVEYQAELSIRVELSEVESARDTLAADVVNARRQLDHHLAQVRHLEREIKRKSARLRELDRRL